jgi:hypothetical protein
MATINISATGTNDATAINSAISAASSGDIIQLADGTYDVNTTILMAAGITLQGTTQAGTLLVAASGFGVSNMVYSNAVNATNVNTMTIDGNGEDNTGGLHFRNSTGHSASYVTVKDVGGPQMGIYGVTNSTFDNLTLTSVTGLTGVSHGFDIGEHSGADCETLTITNSSFENGEGTRDCMKIEDVVTSTMTNCTLTGRIQIDDGVAGNDDFTWDNCTFNGVVKLALTDGTNFPTIQNSTFTRDGGAIQVSAAAGGSLAVNDCTFYGRNKIIGHNGSTWITVPATVTESNNVHPGASEDGGKTVFSSYNTTGKLYNTLPYITPETARNSLENMIEDASLDEANIHYALLSDRGEHTWATNAAPQGVKQTIEGYPGVAVIDLTTSSSDTFSIAQAAADVIFKDLEIKNGSSGQQGFRVTLGTINCYNVTVHDFTSGASIGQVVEVRVAAGNTGYARMVGCEFYNISTTADGFIGSARRDDATANTTLILEGCKIHDCTTTGGGMTRVYATNNPIFKLIGCECYNNVGGFAAGVHNQGSTNVTVENNTFSGNSLTGGTAVDINNVTVALTVTNCIFPVSTNLAGTGAITMSYCLSSDGAGAHTDDNTITGVPTYTDSANDDYTLTAASLGVGVGTRWWTGPEPLGANGEPFSDMNTDIGANQSTNSPNHPVNI